MSPHRRADIFYGKLLGLWENFFQTHRLPNSHSPCGVMAINASTMNLLCFDIGKIYLGNRRWTLKYIGDISNTVIYQLSPSDLALALLQGIGDFWEFLQRQKLQ